MAEINIVTQLREKLVAKAVPAITRWNRLEGRPRMHNFDRALRAEVRDALWMLTRQWQMGEFRGDDAGSPLLARMCTQTTALDRFQPGDAASEPFRLELPLEAQVERRPLPWRAGPQKLALDLRLALGRRWRKLLAAAFARGDLSADPWPAYLIAYKVVAPDPALQADAAVCAHAEAWRQFNAAADRAMDGYRLIEYLDADPNHHAADGIATGADIAALDTLAASLRGWLAQLIEQPPAEGNAAWQPPKLEYQFGCSAPAASGSLVLRADSYHQGHLDWYALERQAESALDPAPPGTAPAIAPPLQTQTFIPSALVFNGMPATRWWAFEDRRTNFGDVKPDTTDLGKLLLLEFGLVYANDWFTFPMTLPIGTATSVKGIALTNVFNERIWIEPVQERPNGAWQRWEMFQPTHPAGTEPLLLLLPAAAKQLEAKPLEEVALVRDEMANMVWGVERRIPLPTGAGKAGGEAALEYRRQLERIIGAPPLPPAPKAPIRYELMNTVPEHWIPFIAVHQSAGSREVRLQRAALPRTLGTNPAAFQKVEPRTALLRENLDPLPDGTPHTDRRYFVDEEEVPRAGTVVSQAFQRTRWLGGRPVVWLGAAKGTGRGEGSSGLAFDRLVGTET